MRGGNTTDLMAWGSVRTSLVPLLLHWPPLLWQLWHGWLLSHLMRFTRHQSHALTTWLRLGRDGVVEDGEEVPG